MKKFFFVIFLLFTSLVQAQVEKVIVETYYVSDAFDATDTTGGFLDVGTKTYRIYVQLTPGSRLKKIYGDSNHALKFASTMNFFNNALDGQTFAKEFTKSRLEENTVALDTWLTLGQTTRVTAKTYFGVLKHQDDDGSIIGGVNNDGGSAAIPGGLIVNNDPLAGIPITIADGMDTLTSTPSSWADYGFIDLISGIDSTIFGSTVLGNVFESYNCGLQNSGVTGVIPDSNQVLVAQLTTKGDITFELNLLVEVPGSPNSTDIKYVAKLANGELNSDTLKLSPYLMFPPACGCRDAKYLEYSDAFGCNVQDSCKTLIVYGCTDSSACNYDPDANFNVPRTCCYPGYCNDRDLAVVCPQLNNERNRNPILSLYPNPANTVVNIEIDGGVNSPTEYIIYNSIGSVVSSNYIGLLSGVSLEQINISEFKDGVYLIRIISGQKSSSHLFLKK